MIVTLFVLLAFTAESFAVQTHVHFFPNRFAGRPESAAGISVDPLSSLLDLAKDTKDANGHCPLCQAVLLSGSYLIPAAVQIHLPFVYTALGWVGSVAVSAITSCSHAWQSRAPPIA